MNGPYFEETILVTPSRLDRRVRDEIATLGGAAADALGLVQGPIHAEARIGDGRVSLLEVAARSIGGLCGRSLRFGLLGTSLETTLLRSALGYRGASAKPQSPASGVMMLPIARAGTLPLLTDVRAGESSAGHCRCGVDHPHRQPYTPPAGGRPLPGFPVRPRRHPKLSGGGVAAPSPRRADHRHSLNSPAPKAVRRNSRARIGR